MQDTSENNYNEIPVSEENNFEKAPLSEENNSEEAALSKEDNIDEAPASEEKDIISSIPSEDNPVTAQLHTEGSEHQQEEPMQNDVSEEGEASSSKDESDESDAVDPQPNEKSITQITAGLWKYHPVPENDPEPFPEYLVHYEKNDRSTVIGARVRGKKHKHEGTNCDDWFQTGKSGDVLFIAASDGAGSKKYSRIGAKAACQSAIGYLKETFDNFQDDEQQMLDALSLGMTDEKCIDTCKKMAGYLQEAVVKAYQSIESAFLTRYIDPKYSESVGRAINIRDFSSTFLIALVIPIPESSDEKLFVTCQVGDGMITLIDTNGEFNSAVKLMGEPDSGDFSGETDFLVNKKFTTTNELSRRTKITIGKSDVIMLMSDGVADDYFPNESQMYRLYLDLVANGILEINSSVNEMTTQHINLLKTIPEPIGYPWVNDNSVTVSLNYIKKIIEDNNISMKELWNNKVVASLSAVSIKEQMSGCDPSDRLKIWLDNYVERGSFDDRTLVIAQF